MSTKKKTQTKEPAQTQHVPYIHAAKNAKHPTRAELIAEVVRLKAALASEQEKYASTFDAKIEAKIDDAMREITHEIQNLRCY